MAFRFSLQAVLHLRQSIEHLLELRLLAANQQVARVQQEISLLDDYMRRLQLEASGELVMGTTAAQMKFALEVQEHLQQARQRLELELLRVTRLRDQQQQAFQRARQEREKFEILREHQWQEYRRDQDRREQKLLDELFLARQAYRRRG